MDTEIKNYSVDDAISANIQHHVNQSAIAFSKRMIAEGLAEENISKVEFYTKMWGRYIDLDLKARYG